MQIKSKLKSKNGQIADILMFFIFTVFVIYFTVMFTSMQLFFATQKIVDNIVRDEVEIIRTKGILTTSEYEAFLSKVGKYGNFKVYIFAEKQDNAGIRGKWFVIDTILDKPFRTGDFIKIMVESEKPALFSTILNANFLFSSNHSTGPSFKMQSLASAMIVSDGFIRGVEAINIINKYASVTPQVTVSVFTLDYSVTPPSTLQAAYDYSGSTYDTTKAEHSSGWINYEGRYLMDVQLNSTTYAIEEIEFKEQLASNQ